MSKHAHFDGMSWPLPDELEYTLRYGTPSRGDILMAASIVSAYQELIFCTDKKRRTVVRELRKAIKPTPERRDVDG